MTSLSKKLKLCILSLGAYISDIANCILIRRKRAEIHSKKVNWQLWRKKWILRHCDVDLWPKVTNFSRIRVNTVSNHFVKTASKSVHSFGWNFVHMKCRAQSHTHTHTHTHTQRDRHTDKLQWKYNPSTFSWRCKKRILWFSLSCVI